jgi:hypothetical protein
MNNTPQSAPSLFRIIVLHGGPKDSHTSTETYLVAESEEEVCSWIDREKNHGLWFDEDEDADPNVRSDDSGNEIPFRQWVMLKHGDLEDEEGWSDAYYGVTKWGWEAIEASPDDIATLLRLGIAVKVTDSTGSDVYRALNPAE